ncbi:MAG TPA: hypothetical protein VMH91_03175 [Candidatus Paceibacterota bacterium]|nr:hypothetical protein [Candidatus Paceibacterota bacterium]
MKRVYVLFVGMSLPAFGNEDRKLRQALLAEDKCWALVTVPGITVQEAAIRASTSANLDIVFISNQVEYSIYSLAEGCKELAEKLAKRSSPPWVCFDKRWLYSLAASFRTNGLTICEGRLEEIIRRRWEHQRRKVHHVG